MKIKLLITITYTMLSIFPGGTLQAMQQQPGAVVTNVDTFFREMLNNIYRKNTKGALDTLRQGLEQGFDINYAPVWHLGQTILFPAVFNDNPDLVNALLAAGANPNAHDSLDDTPLHYAYTPVIIQALVQAGANVNAQDQKGNTPLIRTVKTMNIETLPILQALLNIPDIDVMIKNNEGKTALDVIRADKNLTPEDKQKIINLLKSHMTLKERSLDYIRQHKEKFEKQIKKLPPELRERL